jgi:diacylglycerol kinase (ATP)
MNNKNDPFLVHRIKSFGYALKGMLLLLKTESSIQIQFFLALLVTAAGFYFEISATEWILQVITIALVMSIEGLNTALEKLCDFIHEDYDPKVGFIKDIAAGAVFFTAIAALIVALIIYLPKIG